MPIYEYQCPDCDHRFEKLQKMSDDPVKDCPECGEGAVRKLVSQSAFILKGSGWYKDHYGLKKGDASTDKGGSEAKKGDASSSDAGSSDAGSSDASSGASSKADAASTPGGSTKKASGDKPAAKKVSTGSSPSTGA